MFIIPLYRISTLGFQAIVACVQVISSMNHLSNIQGWSLTRRDCMNIPLWSTNCWEHVLLFTRVEKLSHRRHLGYHVVLLPGLTDNSPVLIGESSDQLGVSRDLVTTRLATRLGSASNQRSAEAWLPILIGQIRDRSPRTVPGHLKYQVLAPPLWETLCVEVLSRTLAGSFKFGFPWSQLLIAFAFSFRFQLSIPYSE